MPARLCRFSRATTGNHQITTVLCYLVVVAWISSHGVRCIFSDAFKSPLVWTLSVLRTPKKRNVCFEKKLLPLQRDDNAWTTNLHSSFDDDDDTCVKKTQQQNTWRNVFSLVSHSPSEDERYPIRQSSSHKTDTAKKNKRQDSSDSKEHWGVQLFPLSFQDFPNSIQEVARAAFHAISNTLYQKQCLDPNLVRNVMTSSVLDYRPTSCNSERLGIEIDGARFLLTKNSSSPFKDEEEVERRAIRTLSLVLAGMLSRKPWPDISEEKETLEEEGTIHYNNSHDDYNSEPPKTGSKHTKKHSRPIAVYFNTIRQALLASQELNRFKKVDTDAYNDVQIYCLGQDGIPAAMMTKSKKRRHTTRKKQRKNNDSNNTDSPMLDPTRGLILVVQPATDHVGGTLERIQKLMARLAMAHIPLVMISPRFNRGSSFRREEGFDQGGYFQRSSTYGGMEPLPGPTPWLLRDFMPPIFSWVGCALHVAPHTSKSSSMFRVHDTKDGGRGVQEEYHSTGEVVSYSYYSRVVLLQSVMESGHPWNIFVVEEKVTKPTTTVLRPSTFSGKQQSHLGTKKQQGPMMASYQYETILHFIGSTKTSSGRPNQNIIRVIFDEWNNVSTIDHY